MGQLDTRRISVLPYVRARLPAHSPARNVDKEAQAAGGQIIFGQGAAEAARDEGQALRAAGQHPRRPGRSFADPVEEGHYFASLDVLFSEETLTRILDS